MAKVYEINRKEIKDDLEHFKAIAVNRLVKEYGEFERVDFVVEKEIFKAVAYFKDEVAPIEQKAGELLSEAQALAAEVAEDISIDSDKFCLFAQQLAPVKDKANGNGIGQS